MRVAIIGGGILGISLGLAALRSIPNSRVTLIEKESSTGKHASSRNSGVLHSGVYYSADSLKAKFSVSGNEALRALVANHGLPILKTGKLILNNRTESTAALEALAARGIANGVKLQLLEEKVLREFDQRAITQGAFIHVESTAVSSPTAVLEALLKEYELLGGALITSRRIDHLVERSSGEIAIPGIEADLVINAAGAGALRLAQSIGVGQEYLSTPFLGLYWSTSQPQINLQYPIYPIPHPIDPFLGVHLTPTIDSRVKIGPTAIPVLGKEQYGPFMGWNMSDAVESLRAFGRLAAGQHHSLTRMILSELPKFMRSKVVRDAAQLHRGALDVRDWRPHPGGIRAQLIDSDGLLVQDFIVREKSNSLHVLNSVSPGWTSAIPFAQWIFDTYIQTGKN